MIFTIEQLADLLGTTNRRVRDFLAHHSYPYGDSGYELVYQDARFGELMVDENEETIGVRVVNPRKLVEAHEEWKNANPT